MFHHNWLPHLLEHLKEKTYSAYFHVVEVVDHLPQHKPLNQLKLLNQLKHQKLLKNQRTQNLKKILIWEDYLIEINYNNSTLTIYSTLQTNLGFFFFFIFFSYILYIMFISLLLSFSSRLFCIFYSLI